MKPFLGIDLTENKKNEQFNGEEFLVARPSAVMAKDFEKTSEKAEKTVERAKLPLAVRIVQWVCGFAGLLVVTMICRVLGGEDGLSFKEVYQNAPWLFWLAGGCLLIWGVLAAVSAGIAKKVLSSEESAQVLSEMDDACDSIFTALSVPKDAGDVDILSFFYKEKEGEIKVCEKALQSAPYFNPVFKLYADSEKLYLANLEGKYAFPLSSVRAIQAVKERIVISGWNKEESFKEGIYKPYKLTADDSDCIHCKSYYILELDCGGEEWGIYFPCYELPAFEAVTGLKAQEE